MHGMKIKKKSTYVVIGEVTIPHSLGADHEKNFAVSFVYEFNSLNVMVIRKS
jgi:hypothetical protein